MHLVVVQHGLWGQPGDVQQLCLALQGVGDGERCTQLAMTRALCNFHACPRMPAMSPRSPAKCGSRPDPSTALFHRGDGIQL